MKTHLFEIFFNKFFKLINLQGHNAGSNGWTHDFVIHMFNQQKPGTIPVAVGHANSESGITIVFFIEYFP